MILDPQKLIKNHSYMCVILRAGQLYREMRQPQITFLGTSHTHMATSKACQIMCAINCILFPMHRCANSHNENSSNLSMDHWLNAVCHFQHHSCTLHFISSTLDMHFSESCLFIHHKLPFQQHSLQPHSAKEPLPPLCAHCMLICTKEWPHPEGSNIVSKCNHTKEDDQQASKCSTISISCLSIPQ